MPEYFDAVVAGAGPAGAAAALVLARAGKSVCLLERGPFPGSKNMYGGVIYGRILDTLIPGWWEQVPVQRWITRRETRVMTPTQSLTIGYSTQAWGRPPYNGMTALRPDFDRWFADQAVAAGAVLVTSTVATGLLRDEAGRVTGVRTDRPEGELAAGVVIACDGVNSFLAKEAGLYPPPDPAHFTLGVKEVLALPRGEIDRRFGVSGDEGVDIEALGVTGGIPGGGFVYTNLDTIAIGVVVQLTGLAEAKARPEELISEFKRHPAIAPLVAGADLKEYSAHLIPEGGFTTMPRLACDGMLVAGDAAGMTLATGLWLEGVNFAIGSGAAAGEAASEALDRGDTSAAGLAGYRRRLEESFVLKNHKKLRRAPGLLLTDRVQHSYAPALCEIAEKMFTVTDPAPKPGLGKIFRAAARRHKLRLANLVRDGWAALRSFG
ncbi:MAG: FAD-dependent oxidoreductase [Micromonosporaceae bacterium]